MRNSLSAAITWGIVATLTPWTNAQDDLLGVAHSGDVYTIDSSTGRGQLLNGARHYPDLNCMAKNAAGVMHSTSTTALITIDEFTGNGSPLATIDLDYVRGLAFAPDGALYAIDDGGIAMPDVLYTIDPITGTTMLIAATSHARIQGLAIDRGGDAFAWDTEAGLLSVDLATGATIDVNGQLDGSQDIESLTFSATGELYGCGYALYTLDRASGVRSLIGSGGYGDIRGVAFIGAGNGRALQITGRCPGRLTVEWRGATPGRSAALIVGAVREPFTIPSGPCGGTVLGISGQVRLVDPPGLFSTGDGSGTITGTAGSSACGRYLQLIEGGSCATSNVAPIP